MSNGATDRAKIAMDFSRRHFPTVVPRILRVALSAPDSVWYVRSVGTTGTIGLENHVRRTSIETRFLKISAMRQASVTSQKSTTYQKSANL